MMLVAAGLMTGCRQGFRGDSYKTGRSDSSRDDDLRNRGLLRERLCKRNRDIY